MTPDPAWLAADETADRAAALFAESGAGVLPVCTRDRRPIGVVTDRDLVVRVLAQGADPAATKVGEVAEGPPVVAGADEPIEAAAVRLAAHGLRRLPVVEGGRLVGVVTRRDLAARLGGAERPDTDDHRSRRWLFGRSYEDQARGDGRREIADEAVFTETVLALARETGA